MDIYAYFSRKHYGRNLTHVDIIQKKRQIDLKEALREKRIDVMLWSNESSSCDEREKQLVLFIKEQMASCQSMYSQSNTPKLLIQLEETNVRKLMTMKKEQLEFSVAIRKIFMDAIDSLKEFYPQLTRDDAFYCILSLLLCSHTVIQVLMKASPDALKTRKSRIKKKMSARMFEYIFSPDK